MDDVIRAAALAYLHGDDSPQAVDLAALADALGVDRADVEAFAEAPC